MFPLPESKPPTKKQASGQNVTFATPVPIRTDSPAGLYPPAAPLSTASSTEGFQDLGPASPQSPTTREKVQKEALSRKRISSISTSQPNIAITSLTPPKPKKDDLANAPVANGYKRWSARPGTLIANTLMAAGCDHVMTMDLHDPQFQGIICVS